MNIILEKAPEILDTPGNRCYFPVGIFPKTGYILAFWSDTPCGNIHNQERGWIIYNPYKKEILDECSTFSWGCICHDYKDWKQQIKEQYGSIDYFVKYNGTRWWKIKDS